MNSKIYKKIITILAFFFILICLVSCNGQSNIKKTSTPSLNNSADLNLKFRKGIISIFQDSKMNYWIGSKEEGVCKFDGKAYQYFTTKNGLPHNQVYQILENKSGEIIIKTGAGICIFDEEKFTSIPFIDHQNLNESTDWNLKKEDFWFSIPKDGLLRYRNRKLEYFAIPIPKEDLKYTDDRKDKPYFYPYSAWKIYQDKVGKLWVGTFNRGVIEYDGKTFAYHNPDNFGVGTIRSIFQDQEGNYWFGSNGGGLYKYDGTSYINFTKENDLVSSNPNHDEPGTLSRVWSIEQDDQGNMWFGTADSGLWKFDGKKLINYTMQNGLPSNFVETIYKDKTGKLWFGSGQNSNGVLYTFNGNSFENINTPE